MSTKLIVPFSANGLTLLSFLREHLHDYPSVKAIKRAIDAKQCKINRRVEMFSTHPVKTDDEIEIDLKLKQAVSNLDVLYEDEWLIIYNKPSGKTSESFKEHFLVHRLDKETSGVFLLAKTQEVRDRLCALFAKRQMQKLYLAICDGKVAMPNWRVDNYLEKKAQYEGGSLYGKGSKEKGKRAISEFKSLKTCSTASLLQVQIETGRTHQIRVHLKEKGHPVLGDWQYGHRFRCDYHPQRHLLHALSISFIHPMTGQSLAIPAPVLQDFKDAQKALNLELDLPR